MEMPHFQENLANIKQAITGTASPVAIYDKFMWLITDLQILELWQYDAMCNCMRDITSTVPDMISEAHNNRIDRPLSADVKINGNDIIWHLEPYQDGKYFAFWYDQNGQPKIRMIPATGKYRMRSNELTKRLMFIYVSTKERYILSHWLQPVVAN
jgi:hypothetical protein